MAESPLIVRRAKGVVLVGFRDQSMLDTVTVDSIGTELCALIGKGRKSGIVLDFSNVTFLSSPALSMLLTLRRKADEAGIEVVMSNVRTEIVRLFRITRLDKLFLFFDTAESALAHFHPPTPDENPPAK